MTPVRERGAILCSVRSHIRAWSHSINQNYSLVFTVNIRRYIQWLITVTVKTIIPINHNLWALSPFQFCELMTDDGDKSTDKIMNLFECKIQEDFIFF